MVQYDTVDNDAINHPSHYAEGRKYEPIDVFLDWGLGPLEWQVCKYLSRLGRKGDALEDARKAQFYMNRLVNELEDQESWEDAGADAPWEDVGDDAPEDTFIINHITHSDPVAVHFDGTDIDPDTLRLIFGTDLAARL